MTHHNLDLPFWEDFLISHLERKHGAPWITLLPDSAAAMVCSGCEGNCWQVHESVWRIIRDMPMLGEPVWLRVQL
jgi:transposase